MPFQFFTNIYFLYSLNQPGLNVYSTLIWRTYFQDSASEGEGVGDEIPDIEEKEDGGSGNEFEEDDFIVDAEG